MAGRRTSLWLFSTNQQPGSGGPWSLLAQKGAVTVTGSNFIVGQSWFQFGGVGVLGTCSSTTACTLVTPKVGLPGTLNLRTVTKYGASSDTPTASFAFF